MFVEMWQLYAMQACPCLGATGDAGDGGVLPRGLEVQMWQQVVHAMRIL